jgi:hypothetical protein
MMDNGLRHTYTLNFSLFFGDGIATPFPKYQVILVYISQYEKPAVSKCPNLRNSAFDIWEATILCPSTCTYSFFKGWFTI